MINRTQSSGITLIEVIVSVALFSFMTVVLVHISQDASYRERAVADYTYATLAASSQLEYLKSVELKKPLILDAQQAFPDDENIRQLREGSGVFQIETFKKPGLYKISVTVSWKDMDGRKKQCRLSALKEVASGAR